MILGIKISEFTILSNALFLYPNIYGAFFENDLTFNFLSSKENIT